MSTRSPFAAVERLLIDGNNLLHRVSGGSEPGAQRVLLAQLQASIPATVAAIVVLDGHPAPGTDRRQRVRRGLEIHHAGSLSADDALINLIRDVSPPARAGVTLVSDDRALTDRARHLGARTQRLAWLVPVLAGRRGGGAEIGSGSRAPSVPTQEQEREPWKPGRGATKKRGNPRRSRR